MGCLLLSMVKKVLARDGKHYTLVSVPVLVVLIPTPLLQSSGELPHAMQQL